MMSGDGSLRGIFPIAPTIFDEGGEVDVAGQRATIESLIHAGVHGLVLLANASEGYSISELERATIIECGIDQARGRVPVVVACSHPATQIALRFARQAEDLGASALMFLPPFFGLWAAESEGIFHHLQTISRRTTVPLILQDHPLSGITLPASFLVDLAQRVERLWYFKVEAPRAPAKIGQMLRQVPHHVKGVFGGVGGILFLEELDQGAVGSMPSSAIPAVFVTVLDLYEQGDRRRAAEVFNRYLPLISFETALGGHRLAKEVLRMAGTIRSAFVRGPIRSTWDDGTTAAFRRMVDGLELLPRSR